MHCISSALKGKAGKPLLFKQTLRSRFTCLACQHFSFYAKKSLDRESPFSLAGSLSLVVPLPSRAFNHERGHLRVSGVLLDGPRKKRDCS